ncbi:hypothetical protein [Oerskovia turbata]
MPTLPPPAPRRLLALVGAVASLGLLTGCVGTGASAAPAPASRTTGIGAAEAAALFDALTAARSSQDPGALTSVATGPALRSASFALATLAAQQTPPATSYTSVPGAIVAPDAGDWFYSLGAPGDPAASDGEFSESTLFTRASADAPWLLTHHLATDPAVPLPQPVLAGGSAVGPDDAARVRGDAALDAVLAFATTGTAAPTLDVAHADQLATAHAQGFPVAGLSPETGTEERSCAYESPAPAWLRSADGIFALVSIECAQTVTLAPGWAARTTSPLGTAPTGARLSAWTVAQTVTVLVEAHDDGTSRAVGSRLRPVRTDVTLAP